MAVHLAAAPTSNSAGPYLVLWNMQPIAVSQVAKLAIEILIQKSPCLDRSAASDAKLKEEPRYAGSEVLCLSGDGLFEEGIVFYTLEACSGWAFSCVHLIMDARPTKCSRISVHNDANIALA